MVRKIAVLAVLGALVFGLGRFVADGCHLTYPPGQAPGYHAMWTPAQWRQREAQEQAQYRRELAAQQPAATASTASGPQGGYGSASSHGSHMSGLSKVWLAHYAVTRVFHHRR